MKHRKQEIILIILILRSAVPLLSFQDMVSYFGVKPKAGDKEVAPGYVFMLWYEFSSDFKNAWVRQSKTISKER